MNDYLAKPIKIQQLNDMLRKWIPAKKLFAPGTTLADIAKEEPDYSLMTKEEILESLEGIDIITGIKNCAGSKDVYYDLLQTYATSNLATTLTRYFEAEDLANYAVTAHSIKGASKNIGAHDIADKAYSLERAGERGDIHYIWDNHDELIEDYTALLKKLRKIFFNT
jgi:HPt (histidine-containing phosphotransfer) domain-containing protein